MGKNEDGKLWELVGNGWKGWEINEKFLKERFPAIGKISTCYCE